MKTHSININKIIYLALILLIGIYAMPVKVTATTLKVGVSKSTLRDVFLKLVPDTLIDADMSLPGDFFSVVVTKPSAQL